MQPERTIRATFFTMVALQTIGSIDLKHKLPAPRQYIAIVVLWTTFFLLGETQRFKRPAAQLSILTLLTVLVIGPFGARLVKFFELIARRFSLASTLPPPPATHTPTTPPGPSALGRGHGASFTPAPQPGTTTVADTAPGAAPINL